MGHPLLVDAGDFRHLEADACREHVEDVDERPLRPRDEGVDGRLPHVVLLVGHALAGEALGALVGVVPRLARLVAHDRLGPKLLAVRDEPRDVDAARSDGDEAPRPRGVIQELVFVCRPDENGLTGSLHDMLAVGRAVLVLLGREELLDSGVLGLAERIKLRDLVEPASGHLHVGILVPDDERRIGEPAVREHVESRALADALVARHDDHVVHLAARFVDAGDRADAELRARLLEELRVAHTPEPRLEEVMQSCGAVPCEGVEVVKDGVEPVLLREVDDGLLHERGLRVDVVAPLDVDVDARVEVVGGKLVAVEDALRELVVAEEATGVGGVPLQDGRHVDEAGLRGARARIQREVLHHAGVGLREVGGAPGLRLLLTEVGLRGLQRGLRRRELRPDGDERFRRLPDVVLEAEPTRRVHVGLGDALFHDEAVDLCVCVRGGSAGTVKVARGAGLGVLPNLLGGRRHRVGSPQLHRGGHLSFGLPQRASDTRGAERADVGAGARTCLRRGALELVGGVVGRVAGVRGANLVREALPVLAAGEDGQPCVPLVLGERGRVVPTMPHEAALSLDALEVLNLMRRLNAREDTAGLHHARDGGRARGGASGGSAQRGGRAVGVGGRDGQDDVRVQYVIRVVLVDVGCARLVGRDEVDATGVRERVEADAVLGREGVNPRPDAPELARGHGARERHDDAEAGLVRRVRERRVDDVLEPSPHLASTVDADRLRLTVVVEHDGVNRGDVRLGLTLDAHPARLVGHGRPQSRCLLHGSLEPVVKVLGPREGRARRVVVRQRVEGADRQRFQHLQAPEATHSRSTYEE